MSQGLFHQPSGLTPSQRSAANIREFLGDGTAELRVPGLVKVESVMVGRTPIPLEREYKFPTNNEFSQKIQTTLPHIAIGEAGDGVPVLLRSIHSNDGVWQAGHKVYVGGEWEDDAAKAEATADEEPKPPTSTPPTGEQAPNVVDEIMKLNIEQMRLQAKAKGVDGADGMKKLDLAKALARATGYTVE